MKKSKLQLEKFRIMAFKNLSDIKGGTATSIGFTGGNSENTTFTTDPNKPCPPDTDTSDDTTSITDTSGPILTSH